MRNSQLVSLEVFSPLCRGAFETEPYEAGWASQAIWFAYVDEVRDDATLRLRVQISADGQRWIDSGREFAPITRAGGHFLAMDGFGSWLRLAGTVEGGPEGGTEAMVVHLYLDLKE